MPLRDLTDVTLVSTMMIIMTVMKMKLSRDESYLVMKVIIVKEVMTCDVSPVAMFDNILMLGHFHTFFVVKICQSYHQVYSVHCNALRPLEPNSHTASYEEVSIYYLQHLSYIGLTYYYIGLTIDEKWDGPLLGGSFQLTYISYFIKGTIHQTFSIA